MIITCINGGILPDFNKCIPYGEHDVAMYIDHDIYFVFYDIFDCKTQSRFSLTTFLDIDKEAHIDKEEVNYRLGFFQKHNKALISKALTNPEESLFFNSIEAEVLSKFFYDSRFSCKADIVVNEKRVELSDIEDNSELYERVIGFIDVYNMVEMVSCKELSEIRKGIYKSKASMRTVVAASVATGFLGVVAGIAIGRKFNPKSDTNDKHQEVE